MNNISDYQIDIFGNEKPMELCTKEIKKGKKSFPKMQKIHGENSKYKCKQCESFLRMRYHDKIYFKCLKWIISSSSATDIRANDISCGLIEFKEGE